MKTILMSKITLFNSEEFIFPILLTEEEDIHCLVDRAIVNAMKYYVNNNKSRYLSDIFIVEISAVKINDRGEAVGKDKLLALIAFNVDNDKYELTRINLFNTKQSKQSKEKIEEQILRNLKLKKIIEEWNSYESVDNE